MMLNIIKMVSIVSHKKTMNIMLSVSLIPLVQFNFKSRKHFSVPVKKTLPNFLSASREQNVMQPYF